MESINMSLFTVSQEIDMMRIRNSKLFHPFCFYRRLLTELHLCLFEMRMTSRKAQECLWMRRNKLCILIVAYCCIVDAKTHN